MKKPSAVRATPYVIWVQMIPRPPHRQPVEDNTITYCKQFNATLVDALTRYRDHKTINITSVEKQHFDSNGSFTAEGQEQFWKEIDFHLKQFNRGDIDLKLDVTTCDGKYLDPCKKNKY